MRAVLLAGFLLGIAAMPPAVAATEARQVAAIPVGSKATIVPVEGWSVTRGPALVQFMPPERDLRFSIVQISSAKDAASAADQAWKVAKPDMAWPLRISDPLPARDGWDERVVFSYEVPPAKKALAQAVAYRIGTGWTVVTMEGAIATAAKRRGQLSTSSDTLRPAGYSKETFAGRQPHQMDVARVELLKTFVKEAMVALKVPGVGLAVIDHDRIVFEGGLGFKDLAGQAPVDKDTRFMIASNTKGMATLLLATLVDQGKLDWNKPVIDYMPTFKLGNADTTRRVLVKHLVCACTGLPRKDMQWLFNTRADTTTDETFVQLAATQPTSGFGEMYQYNNLMASAAGYLAAHIIYPDMELGAAFDRAIRERIFDPLGMKSTTLSNARAMAGNWAKPYDTDIDNKVALVDYRYNDTVVPYRPAGGAWSSAHDMALYVRNELDEGRLPNGTRLVTAQNLLARRAHNVSTGENTWYGMGLEDDASMGVSVIQHGGSMFGFKSNWFAVPSAQVGVVVLTNSNSGYSLTDSVKRRLLEILFDGKTEAASDVKSVAKRSDEASAKFKSELSLNASPEDVKPYLGHYANSDLGPLTVGYENGKLMARATSIWAEAALKRNKDGTTSLVTIAPGFSGLDLLAKSIDGKRALVLNDSQHEYVFTESAAFH